MMTHFTHALFLSVLALILYLKNKCEGHGIPQGDVELNEVCADKNDIKKQDPGKNICQKKDEEAKTTLLEKSRDYRDQAKDNDE